MPCNPNKIDYSGQFPQGFDSFAIIEDPRTGNYKKHHFGEVLSKSMTAMLCGMNTFSDIAQQIIVIDGKTLRGSHGLKSDNEHCVSAWAQKSGITLALEYVHHKSNEITTIPKLSDQLELKGHVITLDAMGTQTKIAQMIIDNEAD